MARKVQGKISDSQGNAVAGARVRAWDSDTGADDRMGKQVITGADGRYSIEYAGGHYDPAPHNVTTWRPDIYITVDVGLNGDWIRVHKSGVRSNHRIANDLTINATVSLPNPDARTVSGVVTWEDDGAPVANARVKVRDHDFGVKAAPMGEQVTGPDGKYRIRYAGGHWDAAPHASGLWRPDIFVEVHLKNKAGKWKEVWSSSVQHNHPVSQPLVINASVSPPSDDPDMGEPDIAPPAGAGTVAHVWNRSGAMRHVYVDGAFYRSLIDSEATEVNVPCSGWRRIDAKEEVSDVLNDVTFSTLVAGLCGPEATHVWYEVLE